MEHTPLGHTPTPYGTDEGEKTTHKKVEATKKGN